VTDNTNNTVSHTIDFGGQAVRLAEMLDELESYIRKYSALPHPSVASLIACWIANTYTYEEFRYCGYLVLRSAMPRCGKTRLLRLIGALSKGNSKPTSHPTAAVLYRNTRKVLLVDEADKLRNQDRDAPGALLAVLNAGFEEDGMIDRTERGKNDKWEVKSYSLYGPKAFAGLERVADTLADRAFIIAMNRASQRMPRLNMRNMASVFGKVRLRMEEWVTQNRDRINTAYQDLPDEVPNLSGFDDRYQDIAEPLFVLATLADAERPDGPLVLPRLLEGLRQAAGPREPSCRERGIVAFVNIVEYRIKPVETQIFVGSHELVAECAQSDELSWISNPKLLASFLQPFDLSPRQAPDGGYRGYLITREWIEQWKAEARSMVVTT
jgi:hypothetical protein